MPKHDWDGMLLAFEGIDGAGKTTQVKLLASALSRAGLMAKTSKEPTNGSWGQRIRKSASHGRVSAREELKYFLRDREQHTKEIIKPTLKHGDTVILDRYFYSTVAYQGVRGFKVKPLYKMMRERFIVPDAVFLLDIDPVVSMARIAHRGDIPNEFEKLHSLQGARKIFLSLKGKNVIRIDGSMSVQAVHNEVLQRLIEGPLKKRKCAKSYGCDDLMYCAYRMAGTCEWFNIASVLIGEPKTTTNPRQSKSYQQFQLPLQGLHA